MRRQVLMPQGPTTRLIYGVHVVHWVRKKRIGGASVRRENPAGKPPRRLRNVNAGSLLVGLGVGLVAGFLLFGAREHVSPARGAPVRPGREGSAQLASVESDPSSPARRSHAVRRLEILQSGSADAIARSLKDEPPPPTTDAEEQVLLVRLDEARATGDRPLFFALLRALARSGSERAQQRFIDLMADESLTDLTGWLFLEALKDSRLPWIAEVARRRVEMNTAGGDTSGAATDGWLDLVLLHGDKADVDWALSQSQSQAVRLRALSALVRCPSPNAVERVVEMARAGTLDSSFLDDFAECQPQAAFDLIQEMITAGEGGRLAQNPIYIVRVYGKCVPAGRFVEARRTLLGVSEPAMRTAAVYAVQALAARGFDVSGLEPVVLAPLEILERRRNDRTAEDSRADSEARVAEAALVTMASYAIVNNQVAWSERAAAALEAVGFKEEAAKVQAGLKRNNPWKKR